MGRKRGDRAKTSGMTCLEMARADVEKAFRVGKQEGVTIKMGHFNSYDDYAKTMRTVLNDIAKFEGENSKNLLPRHMNGKLFDAYFEQLIGEYQRGKLSAGTLQKRVDAVEGFRTMVRETNVCGKGVTIRTGNVEERREFLKDQGVIRSRSEITAMKPTTEQSAAVHLHINTKTANGRVTLTVNEFQDVTGARIKSVFKLKTNHIDFDKGTITFVKDKGKFTRTVPMTDEARTILEPLCRGKKAGALVFTMQGKDGKDLSIERCVKTVQTYTNNAAKKSGVNRENRRFTTHSNRKRYAQKLYDGTRTMSTSQIKKKIGEYVRLQGSNKDQIVQRMKNELERINNYRKIQGNSKRDYSHEQLRRMLVSLHLGHSRLDVVLAYIRPDQVRNQFVA